MSLQRVFIYGTLKKGFYFHEQYLGGDKSVYVGKATASPDYSLYVDGMPHLIKEKTDKPVKGEVYEVTVSKVEELDKLEGTPLYYKREIIEVVLEDGKKVTAWAYIRPNQYKGKSWAFKEEEFV